jgi:hypothetical protein
LVLVLDHGWRRGKVASEFDCSLVAGLHSEPQTAAGPSFMDMAIPVHALHVHESPRVTEALVEVERVPTDCRWKEKSGTTPITSRRRQGQRNYE